MSLGRAFVVAPLAGPTALVVVNVLMATRPLEVADLLPWLMITVVGAALFSYPVALFLGVPAYLLLRRWGWHSPFAFLGAGFMLGLVPVPVMLPHGAPIRLAALATWGAFGAFCGLVFWLIDRPDRTWIKRKPDSVSV
jgi:hypothetical protein